MKKVLISRYGAYGDVINCSHLPKILKMNGFDVIDFETNHKGYQILLENPYIDKLIHFEPSDEQNRNRSLIWLSRHWQAISEGYDKFINLRNSIEYEWIAMEDMPEYYMSSDYRRKKYGKINYADSCLLIAGYEEEIGKFKGDLYFNDREVEIVNNFNDKYKDYFKVLVNLSGTSLHKRFIQSSEFIKEVIFKYKDVFIFTTGDKRCEEYSFKHDRVKNLEGLFPFRQVLLLSSKMDCVIGCESGLMVGSHYFGTPTIQLMTAASKINHGDGLYFIQSGVPCSPCHKGPYKYIGCSIKDGYPICVHFDMDGILMNFDSIYIKKESNRLKLSYV